MNFFKIINLMIMFIVAYILFMVVRWFVLPRIRIFPYIYPEFLWVSLYKIFLAACHQIFAYILMFLLIMYVIWLIIKLFVPNFPIPLKKILLRLPPLRQLDQAGIFGLMDGIRKIFISNDTLGRRFARAGDSLGKFLIKSTAFLGRGMRDMGVPVPIPKEQQAMRPATVDDGKSVFTKEEEAKANDEMAQCVEEKTLPIFPEMNGVQKAQAAVHNSQVSVSCKAKTLTAFSNILSTRL